MKPRFRFGLIVLPALTAIALSPLALFAQNKPTKEEKRLEASQRSAQGIVTDADDKPIDGAVVQLKDMKTLQIRSYITKPDGSYHFHGLSRNTDYELRAESKNLYSATKPLSVYDNRKVAIINLKVDKK